MSGLKEKKKKKVIQLHEQPQLVDVVFIEGGGGDLPPPQYA